jgi:predicted nucleic acid-binding Zn ribbon protein
VGPRRRRRRRYNRNVVELFLGIVAIVFVVLLLWLFGVTG